MLNSREWRQGRLGEILQFFLYIRLGVEIEDLADRTHKRAPLLHGKQATIRSPDANAIKTARFFLEFKTKTHHQEWRGGSATDSPRVGARIEEGIDRDSWQDYQAAQKRWKQPVILSILSIREAEIIAASLEQLGKPRHSPHPVFDLVNWNVKKFNVIARFDPQRLDDFFNSTEPRFVAARERWLQALPRQERAFAALDWLQTQQIEFEIISQHIFDMIERDWQ